MVSGAKVDDVSDDYALYFDPVDWTASLATRDGMVPVRDGPPAMRVATGRSARWRGGLPCRHAPPESRENR